MTAIVDMRPDNQTGPRYEFRACVAINANSEREARELADDWLNHSRQAEPDHGIDYNFTVELDAAEAIEVCR